MAVTASLPEITKALSQARRGRGLLAIPMLVGACTAGPIDVAGLAPSTLRMGVVAHWTLDEGTGSMATDRSGHGHDGILGGGRKWIASPGGRFGGALHFDIGDEIAVPSFPAAKPSWSVALWVRPPTGDFGTDYLTLISTENVFSGGWEMNLWLTAADAFYQVGYFAGPNPQNYYSYDCRCVVSQWTHIVGIVDSATATLSFYRDGDLQTPPTSNVTQPIKVGSDTLYMGRWSDFGKTLKLRSFTGDLDDVIIYDRALTAAEVKELHDHAAPDPR